MLRRITTLVLFCYGATVSFASDGGTLMATAATVALHAKTSGAPSSKKKAQKPSTAPARKPAVTLKPGRQYLTFKEVEERGIYPAIETYLYRMCIKEVPFFLALHQCFFRDKRLDRGDTLVLKKKVLSALLVIASQRFSTSELTISPVVNIDSMMIYRPANQKKKTTHCAMIVYTVPGVYDIPKTGAKVSVPGVVRGIVYKNEKSGAMAVAIQSKGVRLQLPAYAKALSLGMLSDMDVRYAELVPAGPGFEARLMYPVNEKQVKRRGWSLNVTECNKIKQYAR